MSLDDHQAPDREKIADKTTQDADFIVEEKEKRFIGAYQIVRQMGEGGMGSVYLGVRADKEFKRHVAIKVIKRGMDSEAIISRFRRERQILASLDHPNIAKLLDGGTTEQGLLYFVMEHIAGKPLTDYCDNHKLTIRERLKLFRSICSAVQYAHQNLIVHRDLKPGNILVTADGEVKLLDFGIAKLLNPDVFSDNLPLTATDMRAMTPEYASPEQARGDSITTASDVYSLGVILYELLTGRRPHKFTSKNPIEMLRVISEEQPEKPSTAITKSKDADTGRLTTLRGGTPEKLQKQLRGDLDNIILMALRKEPQRRYASAEAFSEDIRRYLEGHPVTARKGTWSYRTGKYVRRHKAWVTAASAVFLLLIAFSGIVAFQNIKISKQSVELSRQRDAAVKSEQKAQKITDFLATLFEVNDPAQSKGENLTARQILDRGAERLQKEFKDQPDVQAELMDRVGMLYEKLGIYDRAEALLRQALHTRQSILRLENSDTADSMDNLALVLEDKGELDEAEKLFREALAMVRKVRGNEHVDVATTLNNLANLLHSKGQLDEAEKLQHEALAMDRKLLGNEHPGVATDLNNLAYMLRDKGQLDHAEKIQREALAIDRKTLGNDHPDVARDMNGLAVLLDNQGKRDEAETLYRETLALRRKLYGNEHPAVANSLGNLATLLIHNGKTDEAEKLDREALAIQRKLLGNDHPDLTQNLNNLAFLLSNTGKLDEAENLFREAIAIDRKAGKGQDPDRIVEMYNLSNLLLEKNELDEAEKLLREAYSMSLEQFGKDHVYVAATLSSLAEVQMSRGHMQDARTFSEQVLAFPEDKLPVDNKFRARAKSVAGAVLFLEKKYAQAEALLLDAYKTLSHNDRAKFFVHRTAQRITDLYKAMGKPESAAQYQKLAQH